ncbi:TolC family protein [Natronoflexus pectinivorans]|uniref:Outer membrane protein TolC n=1 Tax=Natronoflexus pectinivorans TaxID=682526 RepID=A0A4R2GF25_9BACT|nr:TolC family protein [Natronoflexus pectinivorans]TCO06795.1 outer membrane protein TolC [Natronoflexus pectinivorans]
MRIVFFLICFGILGSLSVKSQNGEVIEVDLTLDEVIDLAHQQSLFSFRARNMYLSRYWEFRSYRADRLPSLVLNSTPINFDRSVVERWDPEQEQDRFVSLSSFSSNAALSVRQNVTLTGGVFDVTSSLSRREDIDRGMVEYASVPVSVGFTQSLNGYNRFRWESRIEPLKFEQAKLDYLQSIEQLSVQATNHFFNVATAEINQRIARVNYANADTLYRIGRGRFEIGTVTQDELLDLELGLLNAELAVSRAEIDVKQAHASLNSFLALDDDIRVRVIVPDNIPELQVDVDLALHLALENNPDILSYQRQVLEAEQNVARTRSETGLNANIRANLGINKNAGDIDLAYRSPFLEQQQFRVGVSMPIVDWGVHRGRVQMARSNQEVTEATVMQALQDFEQDAIISVLDFNLQRNQVAIAARADTIAQMGYDVTMQRFMIGKVDVIRLNSARNSLDAARRAYIDALRRYWVSYYGIRRMTLFDFIENRALIDELDELLQR